MEAFVGFLIVAVCGAVLVGLVNPTALRIKWLSNRVRVVFAGVFAIILLSILVPGPDVQEITRESEGNGNTKSSGEPKATKAKAEDEKKVEKKEMTAEERAAHWRYRRTEDPSYIGDIRKALKEYNKQNDLAQTAIDKKNYKLAQELTGSCEGRFYNRDVYFTPKAWLDGDYTTKPNTWFYPEEEKAWNAVKRCNELYVTADHKSREEHRERKGHFTTRSGTFSRTAEFALAEKFIFYNADGLVWNHVSDDAKPLVKSIDFDNGSLSVALRVGSDAYRLDIVKGEVVLEHPIETMRNSMRFFRQIFRPKGWPDSREREFQKVKKVTMTLYFPGEQHSTEVVLARYGLSRSVFEDVWDRKQWGKMKVKDGTFQDLLKAKGLYYLHRDMPDLGTPSRVLN